MTIAVLIIVMFVLMFSGCDSDDKASEIIIKSKINLVYPRDGSGGIQRLMSEFEDLRGDVTINAMELPGDKDGYFEGYTAAIAANQRPPDIMILHDTWLTELASKGFIQSLDDGRNIEVEKYYFPGMAEAVTWNESKYGVPLWQDMPLLYYRTDLVASPPNTWSELVRMAEDTMEGFDLSHGLIFPASDVEARASFMASLLISHNALPDFSQSEIVFDAPNLRSAFDQLIRMLEGEVLTRNVLDMSIEDCRQVFESGDASYMINWSYAARLLNREDSPLAGRADNAPVPMGSSSYEAQGLMSGWVMALSSQTQQGDMAQAIIGFLMGNNNQERMAVENGQMPAKVALYNSEAWQKATSISQVLPEMVDSGIPLKIGPNPEKGLYLLSDLLVRAFNGASSQDLLSYLITETGLEPTT